MYIGKKIMMMADFKILQLKNNSRENALDENTAQTTFENKLKTLSKNVREIILTGEYAGNLDLGVLQNDGFSRVKSIFISNTTITGLANIPEGIEILHCESCLLKELTDLPLSLKELNVKFNLLENVVILSCKKLERLNVSFNNLVKLNSLPESLVELRCDHNNIKKLDFEKCVKLKVLFCENNQSLELENIPDSVVEGNYPKLQITHGSKERIPDSYKDGLFKYFRMKNEYEKQKQKKKTKDLPKCAGCDKNVGMVFSNKHRKYQVRCGGNPPCEWSIVLHRGQYVPRQEVLMTYYKDVEDMKQNIIEHKMSTLFRHIAENKSSTMFEQQLKAYTSANTYLQNLFKEQQDIYFNQEKSALINSKQLQINIALERVNESLKNDNLKEAVQIQYQDIMPLSQSIQRLLYETMQIIMAGDDPHYSYILVQEEVSLDKMEINLGESPSVQH